MLTFSATSMLLIIAFNYSFTVLLLPPHSKKGLGWIPAWGTVQCSGGLSPGPSWVEFAYSPPADGTPQYEKPNTPKCRAVSCPAHVPGVDMGEHLDSAPRCHQCSCPLLLGGATPGWEKGKYLRWTLWDACEIGRASCRERV